MSEREKFQERFAAELRNGLVDEKYYLRDGVSLSPEQFYEYVNRMDVAADANKAKRHKTWNKA